MEMKKILLSACIANCLLATTVFAAPVFNKDEVTASAKVIVTETSDVRLSITNDGTLIEGEVKDGQPFFAIGLKANKDTKLVLTGDNNTTLFKNGVLRNSLMLKGIIPEKYLASISVDRSFIPPGVMNTNVNNMPLLLLGEDEYILDIVSHGDQPSVISGVYRFDFAAQAYIE